ncbi:MAG: efflux RND transporter periplasmic adaptor subunit [Pseudomonadota bacterium]
METRSHLILITSCLCMLGCGQPPAEKHHATRPAKLVTVYAASQEREFTFPAVIRAQQSAELTFSVPGQVIELSILEGEEIAQGTTIAKLDQRDARNNLAQASAEFENAQSEYQRAQRLVEQDAISRSVLESRKTALNVRQTAVELARKALEDTVIVAPFDGSISKVYVDQYQNVQAKEPIAAIQTGATEAFVDIPGTILARTPQLEPKNTVVVLDAAPDLELPAEFREASGLADPNTQTYEIGFTFEPPEGLLILPGMTANVHTTFLFKGSPDILAEGISVPLNAILAEGDSRFVWVVDNDRRLRKTAVTVGPDLDESVTVTSGLEGGETIVAAGVSFLHEGMTVRDWIEE